MKKKWSVCLHEENKSTRPYAKTIGSVILKILNNRGITQPEDIQKFIYPRLSLCSSPFLLPNINEAIDFMRLVIEKKEPIAIFADSDIDGLASMSIVYELLSKFGLPIYCRYPQNGENYGLTKAIIDDFYSRNIMKIITVDSGTRDIDEINYANSLGMKILVTDHHEPDDALPSAVIVNPKLSYSEYPFRDLAGVGVVFLFSLALLWSYMPLFNHSFIIADKSDDVINIVHVKNAAEIERYSFQKESAIEYLKPFAKNSSTVIYFDDVAASMLESADLQLNTICLYDFLKKFSGINAKNLNDINRALGIRKFFSGSRIDDMMEIILEAQYNSSQKVSEFINSVSTLVSIGTIADVMPLIGDNRILVKYGLANFMNVYAPGLAHMAKNGSVTAKTIAWDMAPILNTPGRYGKTAVTADFLLEKNSSIALKKLSEMQKLNDSRKSMLNSVFDELIDEIYHDKKHFIDRILHVKTDRITEGFAGLLANKLADAIKKPTIVTILPGTDGIVKGSGRARSREDFLSVFTSRTQDFVKIGGHAQAFGFTIDINKLDELIHDANAKIDPDIEDDLLIIDCEIDIKEINDELISSLNILEPYGKMNEEPLFISKNVSISSFSNFGNNHGKFITNENECIEIIGWKMSEKMHKIFKNNDTIDIVYRLENNFFNGSVIPRVILIDFRPSINS